MTHTLRCRSRGHRALVTLALGAALAGCAHAERPRPGTGGRPCQACHWPPPWGLRYVAKIPPAWLDRLAGCFGYGRVTFAFRREGDKLRVDQWTNDGEPKATKDGVVLYDPEHDFVGFRTIGRIHPALVRVYLRGGEIRSAFSSEIRPNQWLNYPEDPGPLRHSRCR